jgi:signal transduction histidine kinase
MTADRGRDAGDPWVAAVQELSGLLDGEPLELRYALDGGAAVRVLAPRGPVAPRHAEAPEVRAPWSVAARCGQAAGWLLAGRAPADPARALAVLQQATDRHTALVLQGVARQQAALTADLLEAITHRLRTDVSTLQLVAEGALAQTFPAAEVVAVAREVRAVGEESQRRMTAVRDVMAAYEPEARRRPEPVVQRLQDALDATGCSLAATVQGADGEQPMAMVPGPGWEACSRLLAEAVAGNRRFGGSAAEVAISAHPGGWRVIAGAPGAVGAAVPWTQQQLGPLVHAGQIVSAAGGSVSAARVDGDGLRIDWTVPAAPSA